MKVQCSYHKNKKMNTATYKLRREIIEIIYAAKEIAPNLPRIEVRITDCERKNVLGTARLGKRMLWIPESTIKMDRATLVQTVLHELLHAAYALEHDEKCDLMCSVHRPMPEARAFSIFRNYVDMIKGA